MENSDKQPISPMDFIRMEEGLNKRKELLEGIIQRAPSIIIGVNLNGRIMIFNETAIKLTGYSVEEALGESFILLLVPERERVEISGLLEELDIPPPYWVVAVLLIKATPIRMRVLE